MLFLIHSGATPTIPVQMAVLWQVTRICLSAHGDRAGNLSWQFKPIRTDCRFNGSLAVCCAFCLGRRLPRDNLYISLPRWEREFSFLMFLGKRCPTPASLTLDNHALLLTSLHRKFYNSLHNQMHGLSPFHLSCETETGTWPSRGRASHRTVG